MELFGRAIRNERTPAHPRRHSESRRGEAGISPLDRHRRRVAHADLSHRKGAAQGIVRLLLLHRRLLRRESRIRLDGRLRLFRRQGPCAGHQGIDRLGGEPHLARRRVAAHQTRRLVRARSRRRGEGAVGLDRHGQARLFESRRMARPDRSHALLGRTARHRRIPLRHGHAHADRVLAGGVGRAPRRETRYLHAGRSRGAEPLRPRFRHGLRVGDTSHDVRHRQRRATGMGFA